MGWRSTDWCSARSNRVGQVLSQHQYRVRLLELLDRDGVGRALAQETEGFRQQHGFLIRDAEIEIPGSDERTQSEIRLH